MDGGKRIPPLSGGELPGRTDLPEELLRVFAYLPGLYQDESEEQYIDALALMMRSCYANRLYQFAYVQYHMLFMAAVYCALLKTHLFHEREMENALYYLTKDRFHEFFGPNNTKDGKLYFGSFAAIGESEVFKLLRIVGMDASLEGELKGFVKERNRYAHANGRLLLTSDQLFFEKIRRFNQKLEQVYGLLKEDVLALYQGLLRSPDFYDPEIRAYTDDGTQVQEELVRKYALCPREVDWCRRCDIRRLEGEEGYPAMRRLHGALGLYARAGGSKAT